MAQNTPQDQAGVALPGSHERALNQRENGADAREVSDDASPQLVVTAPCKTSATGEDDRPFADMPWNAPGMMPPCLPSHANLSAAPIGASTQADEPQPPRDPRWPDTVKTALHRCPLTLLSSVYVRGAYICDGCRRPGRNWVYHCSYCKFDLHPECAPLLY